MDSQDFGLIQIISVESRSSNDCVCVVRCVGGAPRIGQHFTLEEAPTVGPVLPILKLEWINRYGQHVDFFDPPHGAKILLSGADPHGLVRKGVVLHETST